MTTKSYHVSNLGTAGRRITTDLDGYVHLTAAGWMAAPMDWGPDWDDESRLEQCEEMAAEARNATAAAEAAIEEWRADR